MPQKLWHQPLQSYRAISAAKVKLHAHVALTRQPDIMSRVYQVDYKNVKDEMTTTCKTSFDALQPINDACHCFTCSS